MTAGTAAASVPIRIMLPADPEAMAIGGIATFVRGFVRHAPPDFELSMVGISGTRPLWQWQVVELEGRPLRLLPVVRHRGAARARIPLAARFALALAARGRSLGDGVVASFHRPLSDRPLRALGPMWRVVHLGVDDLLTSGSESRWARAARALAGSEARSFARMDRIYVVNRRVAEEYRVRFPSVASRISFLPNWFESALFHLDPDRAARRAALVAQLGVDPSAPLLLYAGRLEGQKNPGLLAAAFAALRRRRPGVHLLVAGGGGLEPFLRRALAEHGAADDARLLGTVPRPRLAELMHAADALVITSAFETGPTVGLEALACGLPVVTTPVGEVAEAVARSGAGAVAARHDADAVADAADAVLSRGDDLRAVAVEAAAPFAVERVLGTLYDDNRQLAERIAR